MGKYCAYILESTISGKWYYGSTGDVEKRLAQHNCGSVASTKSGRPWQMIYKEEFIDKMSARAREQYFKRTRNKLYLRNKLGIS